VSAVALAWTDKGERMDAMMSSPRTVHTIRRVKYTQLNSKLYPGLPREGRDWGTARGRVLPTVLRLAGTGSLVYWPEGQYWDRFH